MMPEGNKTGLLAGTSVRGEDLDEVVKDILIGEMQSLRRRVERLRQMMSTDAARNAYRNQLASLASLRRGEPIEPPLPHAPLDRLDDFRLLQRSVLFDGDWYLRANPDVARSGESPIVHYLIDGAREGRDPGPAFQVDSYLAANPDVAASGMDALIHYERKGRLEGRPLKPDVSTPLRIFSGSYVEHIELDVELRSYDEYLQFERVVPLAFSQIAEETIRDHALLHGTRSFFMGHVGAANTTVIGQDLREHLISAGLNSRQRAVADMVLTVLREANVSDAVAKVYGHEAITPLARLMRNRFDRFVGSEYAPTPEAQQAIFPAMHNDVCASRFEDESLNVIFSCDVLEHVYDRDAFLSEAARTLVKGGSLVATFPFDQDQPKGWLMAELRDGELIHLIPDPIYHGNPMDPSGGSLVFEIPGWDIVDRAIAAGFRDAAMHFICDQWRGIVSTPQGGRTLPRGVFVFVCQT